MLDPDNAERRLALEERRRDNALSCAAGRSGERKVPFQSARATHPSGPTGLADGLGLKGAPTRIGESTPRRPQLRTRWFPRSRAVHAGLGYTSANIESQPADKQVPVCFYRLTSIADATYEHSRSAHRNVYCFL